MTGADQPTSASRRSNLRRWGASCAIACLVVIVARFTDEWWVISDPDLKVNLWAARATLFVATLLCVRGLIAAVPRMNRRRWVLLGFWSLYLLALVAVSWPAALMSDSVQEVAQSRQLVVSTWFSWIYGLANIALLDVVPHVWFLSVVQALGTAAVLAYAGDVISRRGAGARFPVIAVTAVLALSAPVVATTLLQSRDTPFAVLHLLLALVLLDTIGVRKRVTPVGLVSIGVLVGVLSVLRGDGVVLLLAPLALLLLRPDRKQLLVGTGTVVGIVLAIRVVVPAPLVLDNDPFRYGLTLRLSALSAILAQTSDTADRRTGVTAADRATFDAQVAQPFFSETPEQDLRDLSAVLDLERVEQLAVPTEIPAFWAGAYRADASPAELERFNEVADRLIRDNLATVLADKLQSFSAASGLAPRGFTGVVSLPSEQRFDWIPEERKVGVAADAPFPDLQEDLGRLLASTASYDGLRPGGAALFWNLLPWMFVLLIPIVVRGRLLPEAVFAAVILARVPLVFLAAPAAQFKYYYSVYLGGVVCAGLLLAARAARSTEPGPSAPESAGPAEPADPPIVSAREPVTTG
ncbi:MAG: hypothetical protein JHD02_09665 [Thermoleophilaceae bacterium]|nr:hypothetical protein [Thermoleophilaceae bacterium]